MIDRETALLIAEKALEAIGESIGIPVALWQPEGREVIEDHNDVWLIHWNSVEYIETLDVFTQILSGPIAVPKDGRQPFALDTWGTYDEVLVEWRGRELAQRFEGFDLAEYLAPTGYLALTPQAPDLVSVGDFETEMHLTDRDGVIVYEKTDRGHRTGVASFSDIETARRYLLLEFGPTGTADPALAEGFALEIGPTSAHLAWSGGWADVSNRRLGERRLRMLSQAIGRPLEEIANGVAPAQIAGPARPAYRYPQRWNFKMQEVIERLPFIDEADARARYEAHEDWFSVVPDVPGIGDRGVVPPFVIEVAVAAPEFKIHYLHESGRFRRVSFFKNIDGRLFLASVIDYGYEEPVAETGIGQIVSTLLEPDGSGKVITRKTVPGQPLRSQEITPFEGADFWELWIDVPAFGDWQTMLRVGDPEP